MQRHMLDYMGGRFDHGEITLAWPRRTCSTFSIRLSLMVILRGLYYTSLKCMLQRLRRHAFPTTSSVPATCGYLRLRLTCTRLLELLPGRQKNGWCCGCKYLFNLI